MKQAKVPGLLILLLPLAASTDCGPAPVTNNGGGNGKTGSENCTCEEYPFSGPCKSFCVASQAVVESVDTRTGTAVVTLKRDGEMERRTVSLGSFPPALHVEKGARFTTLLKKEASGPKSARIVGFTKPER